MWVQVSILILFLLGSKGARIQETINTVTYFSQRVANVIQNKCMNNANDTINEEAISEFYGFQNCWHIKSSNIQMGDEAFYKHCLLYMNIQSINSMKKFLQKIEPCLEPEEQYIPEFITESYGNYNHNMCKFLLVKGSAREKINTCITKFERNPRLDPLVVCFENSTIFGNHIQHLGPITKTKFCSDIKNLEICYENTLNLHCHGVEEVKSIKLHFLKNALENCMLN